MRGALELVFNFHWIVPGEAARAAQRPAFLFRRLAERHGIKSLINLRGHHPEYGWWRAETRACKSLGIAHFDAMLDSRMLPLRAMLVALFDAFDAAPRPFLVKCSGGQDRTSFAASLYIVHRDGWQAKEKALEHFSAAYWHYPKRYQYWLKPFLSFAEEDAKGLSLGEWARTRYEPEIFAVWLAGKGMGDSYRTIFTPH